MRHNRMNKGFTLIEMLVGSFCMIIVGLGCYTLIRTGYDSQWMLMNQNNANTSSRSSVDTMVDKIRGLTTLTAAAQSDISYIDINGATIRYWRNSGDSTIRTSTNGSPSGGTIVATGVEPLVFTYWSFNGTSWSSSVAPSVLANVGAIDITAKVTLNGYLRRVFSSVKLRQVRFNNINGF